jgi:predicted nucleic acid-binding protein
MTPESVLVDSNVFIDLLRRGRDPLRTLLHTYESTDLVTCGVVRAEVLRGIKSIKARNRLDRFFSEMRFADLTSSAWDEVWNLAWQLDRKGRVLPLTDLAIATCALRSGAWIMTSDAHFDQIPGLQVVRPDGLE